jgi:hypothetical protein
MLKRVPTGHSDSMQQGIFGFDARLVQYSLGRRE